MKIAIVEDDINMRKSLLLTLGKEKDLEVIAYKSGTEALEKLSSDIALIITDINMPKLDGIDFIKEVQKRGLDVEFIMITGNATLSRAIEGIRLGVKDFLTKPFELSALKEAIFRARRMSEAKPRKKLEPSKSKELFLASSKALDEAKNMALKAAATDISVMLQGQSGVGKEIFARYIHENSPRVKGPLLAINMAAIPENLLESELFGYEKGAFTDAVATKIGLFEAANGGSLFLDEIAEMPLMLQAKLLRALQEKSITRLGSSKAIKIDVRIISATNADMDFFLREKSFRSDLYYRLNGIVIKIAPLKDRRDEILPLAQEFLKRTVEAYSLGPKSFSKAAQEALFGYDFPGNVRELISIVERSAVLSEGELIEKADLHLEARQF